MAPHLRWSLGSSLAVLTIFLLIGWAVIGGLQNRREHELKTAHDATQTVATLLAAHTSHIIASTDHRLKLARRELRSYLEWHRVNEVSANIVLERFAASSPFTHFWGIFDQDGDLVIDLGHVPARQINIEDRKYFRENRDNPESGLVVSGPLEAKSSGERVFSLSRRIEGINGEFLGVFVVGYDVAGLATFVGEASRSAGVDVQLLHDDGTPAERERYFSNLIAMPVDSVLAEAAVVGTPMTYVASRSRDKVLANWRATQESTLLILAGCALTTMFATFVLTMHLLKRRALMLTLQRGHAEARRASEMKSDFLATISHEIRTPLNGVLGMARLLAQTPLSDDQAHMLRAVSTSGEQLMGVINDVLDATRLESGRLRIACEPFALGETVEAAARSVRGLVSEKDLAFDIDIDPTASLYVRGDAIRLQQVLVNLLTNAVKFTDSGRVGLTCRVEQRDNVIWTSIMVADTGIGIEPARLGDIFFRFTQIDSSAARRSGGSGLGLAIVKTLVELMGGTIAVDSIKTVGSTFTVELPFETIATGLAVTRSDGRRALGGGTALVIDDDDISRETVARTLRLSDMHVVEWSDPRLALRHLLVERHRYDAIVVDQLMPSMRGSDFIAAVRQDHEFAEVPIILMSSAADDVADTGGPNTLLLRRPVMPDVMTETLRCLLPADQEETVVQEEIENAAPASSQPARALVVEDNAISREILTRTLLSLGFEVDEAMDGADAIAKVRRETYEIVLMDVQMPGMDGLEATRQIRAFSTPAASVPIVALTANAMAGDREKFLAAGMDDYVAKPINVPLLVEALQRQTCDTASAAEVA